jgi:hypothetical protein
MSCDLSTNDYDKIAFKCSMSSYKKKIRTDRFNSMCADHTPGRRVDFRREYEVLPFFTPYNPQQIPGHVAYYSTCVACYFPRVRQVGPGTDHTYMHSGC